MKKQNGGKNVLMLGLVSFFNDVASEMIFSLLPIFFTTTLGAQASLLGAMEGIAEATASLLKVFSGWYSDKVEKKKPLVFFGYALSALTKPLFAFATSPVLALSARFADRIGKGIRTTPRDVLISQSTDEKSRGAAFGLHRALDSAGAVVGPLLAAVLLFFLPPSILLFGYNFEQLRLVFLLALIPGILSLAVLHFGVTEKPGKAKRKFELPSMRNFNALPPSFKRFLFASTIFSLANFSIAFLILRTKDLGVSLAIIPLAYLASNLVYAASSLPAGALSDKIGRRKVLAGAFFVFSIVCTGFAFASSQIEAIVFIVLYGLFMGAFDGVSKAFASDLSPGASRGSALGIYYGATGLAALFAGLAAGLLWDSFGAQSTFLFGATGGALSAALMLFYVKEK